MIETNKLIRSDEARRIFAKYSALFGENDGIPESTAQYLLGKEAIDFVKKLRTSSTGRLLLNGFGIGDYTASYLTEQGFYTAVSYFNTAALKAADEENKA